MKRPEELVQHCRRRWWWSPRPFWEYIDFNGRGWGCFVDLHPGKFNLAWRLSGAGAPPVDFQGHNKTTAWVLVNSDKIKLDGRSLPDLALDLRQADFTSYLYRWLEEQRPGSPEAKGVLDYLNKAKQASQNHARF
jgi:hypothetical protein